MVGSGNFFVHGGCEQSRSFFMVAVTGRGVLWTPTTRHASSATCHESHTCDWDQTDDLWQVPHYRTGPSRQVLLGSRRPMSAYRLVILSVIVHSIQNLEVFCPSLHPLSL